MRYLLSVLSLKVMGIHQLITFLKSFNHIDEDNPDDNMYVVSDIPFTYMSGHTLAVDISTILYAQMNGAVQAIVKSTDLTTEMIDQFDIQKIFFKNLITHMEQFLRIQCPLVVVFDGEAPELKDNVRLERRDKRRQLMDKIEVAMEEFNNTEPFDRSQDMIDNLKKLLGQEAHIPDEYVQEVKELFKLMGFSVVQAKGEAEQVCSALCREGYVRAVISTDSDCLVHGCPILISKILKNNRVEVIVLDDALDALEMEFDHFKELCIAAGCDYNQIGGKCIPNCRIKKLYPMFSELGSYKEVVKKWRHKYNFEPVNMKECKRIFKQLPLEDLIEDEYVEPTNCIDYKLREALETYGLCNHLGIILDLYTKFP